MIPLEMAVSKVPVTSAATMDGFYLASEMSRRGTWSSCKEDLLAEEFTGARAGSIYLELAIAFASDLQWSSFLIRKARAYPHGSHVERSLLANDRFLDLLSYCEHLLDRFLQRSDPSLERASVRTECFPFDLSTGWEMGLPEKTNPPFAVASPPCQLVFFAPSTSKSLSFDVRRGPSHVSAR